MMTRSREVLTYCESVPFDFVLYFSISPDSIFFAAYFATADVITAVLSSGGECDGLLRNSSCGLRIRR
jgi:hypothetical protein